MWRRRAPGPPAPAPAPFRPTPRAASAPDAVSAAAGWASSASPCSACGAAEAGAAASDEASRLGPHVGGTVLGGPGRSSAGGRPSPRLPGLMPREHAAMPSIFTRIIAGELPGEFVFKEPLWVAFLDIKPTA